MYTLFIIAIQDTFSSNLKLIQECSSMTSASQTITIDENYPFFLHHGENPGAILVSQPLVSEIYPAWAKSMQRALSAKNKLGFIDGTLTLTPTMMKSPLLVQAWTRCNNMVVSWILNSFLQISLQVWFIGTQLWRFGRM